MQHCVYCGEQIEELYDGTWGHVESHSRFCSGVAHDEFWYRAEPEYPQVQVV